MKQLKSRTLFIYFLFVAFGLVSIYGITAAFIPPSGPPPTAEPTNTIGVSRGGTGLTSLTQGYIPFGKGTSAFGSSANLFWDVVNSRLGIGTAPAYTLDVNGTIRGDGSQLTNLPVATWANGIFTKDIAGADGATTTIAHGLGRIPKIIRIDCKNAYISSSVGNLSYGSYNGSTYANNYISEGNPGVGNSSTSVIAFLGDNFPRYQTATITTLNSTNFVLTWAKTGSPPPTLFYCVWEVN